MSDVKVNIANLASLEKWDEVKAHVVLGSADMDAGATIEYDPGSDMRYTALMYAAYFNHRKMISWLIQHGADINILDRNDKTALHVAAKYGSPNVCRQLLMEGMDPEQQDYWERSAENIANDPGNIVIEGTKKYTPDNVKMVQRVFKLWLTINTVYKSKGAEGLKLLKTFGGVLEDEADCYLALEKSDEVNNEPRKEEEPTTLPVKEAPILRKLVEKMNLGKSNGSGAKAAETPEVFISYCWSDQTLVRKLAQDMKAKGYRIWIDVGQMGGGDELFEAIDSGIRTCKVVISSVSPKYAKSLNCRRELSLASDVRKPIIPIIVDGQSASTWPPVGPMGFLLTGKLYVDLSNNYEEGLNQLTDAVKKAF